jgi:hypothetical protein
MKTTQIELKLYDEHEKVGAIRKFCLIISSFEISMFGNQSVFIVSKRNRTKNRNKNILSVN